MDGDALKVLEGLVDGMDAEDLVTLQVMWELVGVRIGQMQFMLMMEWLAQGWWPNAPGLRCEMCGGTTWGKQEGIWEMVKCVDVGCGHAKRVMVG